MSTTAKLLIPIGLGIAAAVVNWLAVSRQTDPVFFTVAKEDLAAGAYLLPRTVEKKPLPSQYRDLKNTAVLFEEFGAVENSRVQRPLKKGDLIFYADCARDQHHLTLRPGESAVPMSLAGIPMEPGVIRVGNMIEFLIPVKTDDGDVDEWVGPFRVISVGTDFTPRQEKESGRGNSEKITVAVPTAPSNVGDTASEYEKLEVFLARQRDPVPAMLKLVRLHGG
jgi:hypothetical protein